ncbi:FHA domain-containing protein [Ruegeria sp.]|uniref:FHA domain-containing protein n=1 Tax=Ruegeria sp. TaxID=1879320 RepID=UPI003C7B8BE7
MFKYKSPLSRLLEGGGKTKDEDQTEAEVAETEHSEQPAPIADFNALRQALGGGVSPSESYEEADELIPEEKMPEFEEAEEAEPEVDEIEADAPSEEVEEGNDQIVTLHLSQKDAADPEEDMLAAVAKASTEAEEPVAEAVAEPVAPEVETSEPVVEPTAEETPEPVAEETPEPAPEPEATVAEQPEPTPAPATDRRSRVKTTFLGFERADTHVQDMLETAEPVAKSETTQQTFPVGWLVVTSGPGRGACITLTEGLMQIGRNDDQAIQLDFGDTGISRSNHAVVAYDPEDRKCYLGHGGKANLVRLNGKPVLSTVPLSNGDLIRISETSIRFTAFCDDGFDWRDAE